MKTGSCISGPAWSERSRMATPHEQKDASSGQGERLEPDHVQRAADDLHAGDERDDREQHPGHRSARRSVAGRSRR